MPAPMQKFVPSEDELNLASRMLESNTGSWNRCDTLSVDTAIGIFKQSGISFKQIRDIWSIADRDGWVQAGEVLDESLLEKVGPLPKIKGVPDVIPPKIVPLFPPITPEDVAKLKETFLKCNPVNGLLQKRDVMAAYMDSKPDLSFETLFRVIQLVNNLNKIGLFDFRSFAIGLHIVRSLHNSLISTVPLSLPSEAYKLLDDVKIGVINDKGPDANEQRHTESTIVDITVQVDSDIQKFMADVKTHQYISGEMTIEFMSKYSINPTEMAQIWHQSDTECKNEFSPARMTLIEQLIRNRVMKQESGAKVSSIAWTSSDKRPTEKPHLFLAGPSDRSNFPSTKLDPSSIVFPVQALPVTSHMRVPLQQPPSYDHSTALEDNFLLKSKAEVERLTSQLELDQAWTQKELRSSIDALRQENKQLKMERQTLKDQLARKEERCRDAEELVGSTKSDLFEQKVISKEYQESATRSTNESEILRGIVGTQARQITTLLELVADMKTAIVELNLSPQQQSLRLRFLRATVRESEAAATRAAGGAESLRQTLCDRDQEIVRLRRRLEDIEKAQPVFQADKDLQALRSDHEGLKAEMYNMKRLMEHLVVSSTEYRVEIEDQEVQRRESSAHGLQEPERSLWDRASESIHQPLISSPEGHDDNDLPPPFSPLSAHQSVSSYGSFSTAQDTTITPFYLSWKAATPYTMIGPSDLDKKSTKAKVDNSQRYILQLDDDLHLFKVHVQRKGYIGIDMVERLISNYDVDAFTLDEIARVVGLDTSIKRINHAASLIRQALMSSQNRKSPSHNLSRPTSSSWSDISTISSNLVQASDSESSSAVSLHSPAAQGAQWTEYNQERLLTRRKPNELTHPPRRNALKQRFRVGPTREGIVVALATDVPQRCTGVPGTESYIVYC